MRRSLTTTTTYRGVGQRAKARAMGERKEIRGRKQYGDGRYEARGTDTNRKQGSSFVQMLSKRGKIQACRAQRDNSVLSRSRSIGGQAGWSTGNGVDRVKNDRTGALKVRGMYCDSLCCTTYQVRCMPPVHTRICRAMSGAARSRG